MLGELSPKAAELYGRYARYWGLTLILLLASGALSRPLGFLNDAVLNGMWSIIRMILLRLPQPMNLRAEQAAWYFVTGCLFFFIYFFRK